MPGGADDNQEEAKECECITDESPVADPRCAKCNGTGYYVPEPDDEDFYR